jgi:hypothetical protein
VTPGRSASVAVLALVLAGCGGATDHRARLTVDQSFESDGYFEGQFSYLRVEGPVTRTVKRANEPNLHAGRYTLSSWQRGCEAGCAAGERGDPPSARCSTAALLHADSAQFAEVAVDPRRGACRIEIYARLG